MSYESVREERAMGLMTRDKAVGPTANEFAMIGMDKGGDVIPELS